MHAHNEIWIIIGYDHPNPSAFNLPKITPLPIRISFFMHRIGNYEFGIRTTQLVQAQSVLGVFGETHARSRNRRFSFSPLKIQKSRKQRH